MEASCLCSSPSPSLALSPGQSRRRRAGTAVVCTAKRDRQPSEMSEFRRRSGRRVDEGMIVLRKRVHEMKMVERNYEPPADWMDWEKRYYTCYDEYICTVVGLLQAHLMNVRPSVAIGMLALLTMSVPTSTVLILWRLMEMGNGALSAVHLIS